MTLPTNLFIDAPELSDNSLTSLNTNSDEWPEEIITKLKERIPSAGAMSLSIKFMHQNDEVGAATGSLTISDGNKSVVIPIVIKDFKMFPLDIFFAGDRVLPLTNRYFDQFFFDGSEGSFAGLEEYPSMSLYDRYLRGETLSNTIYPPNWGRYSYASVIDEIAGTVDGSDFEKKAKEDGESIANYHKNGTLSVLQKIANLRPVNMGEFRQGEDNLIRRTLHVIKKNGPNRYTILSNQHNQFNPVFNECDRIDLCKFIAKTTDEVDSTLHEVDQNGEKMISISDDTLDSVYLARPDSDSPELADTYGRYNVRTRSGVNVEGMVVPTVINFDQESTGLSLFLGKTTSTIQNVIYGHRIKHSEWTPEGEMPRVGQTGTFLYRDGDRAALGTLPVTIKSMMKTPGCGGVLAKLTVVDLNGVEHSLCLASEHMHLQRITAVPKEGGVKYMIPHNMEWIPMDGFDEISNSATDYAMKTAAQRLSADPLKLIHTGYDQYGLRGADKYAFAMEWDKTCLEPFQLKFLLGSFGMGEKKVAQAMKVARVKGYVDLHQVKYPQMFSEKVASLKPKARELIKQAQSLRADLYKEASYMENAQTVDALLSLNFVTPDNISKFIAKIPLFKATISHLASCLLASRLGVQEIPEQAASSAIEKLDDVVEGLETLRATQKVQGDK